MLRTITFTDCLQTNITKCMRNKAAGIARAATKAFKVQALVFGVIPQLPKSYPASTRNFRPRIPDLDAAQDLFT